MLETLRIQNYALIAQAEIDFQPGFNALTGETGAGKSILIGALNLVLGARASSEAVRKDAKRAHVEAVFHLPKPHPPALTALFKEHDLELEEDRLLLARSVSQDGRSKAYAAGALVPVSVLAAIGDELVDLHGQHEHQSLLKADKQLELLDAFAGNEKPCTEVAAIVGRYRAAEKALEALASDDRDKTRQLEFYRFEVEEIAQADLQPGEEEELKQRLKRISNAEEIVASARRAYTLIYENEDGAATDAIGGALRDLEHLAELDDAFVPLLRQVEEALSALDAAGEEIRAATEAIEYDPQELNEVNQRLCLINDLKRKYGQSVAEILAYQQEALEKIAALEGRDARLEALRETCRSLLAEAEEAAARLSKKRAAAKKQLDKKVTEALQDLGMKGARFETALEARALCSRGVDQAQFLLAANTGEKCKPLRQVASGGEVSRIMLALKSVFAEADSIGVLIFDEIDAGVGGAVARKVAEKMRRLADSHQVLCITHLPQIAAAAHSHYRVEKAEAAGAVHTSVTPVRQQDRVNEVARLLDGSATQVSKEHAQLLLAELSE